MPADFAAVPVDLPDLDHAPAEAILAYAIGRFSPRISVACSMQDAVVVDLAVRHDRSIEVFFLDTGFHFPETLETARRLQARYDLPVNPLRFQGYAPSAAPPAPCRAQGGRAAGRGRTSRSAGSTPAPPPQPPLPSPGADDGLRLPRRPGAHRPPLSGADTQEAVA